MNIILVTYYNDASPYLKTHIYHYKNENDGINLGLDLISKYQSQGFEIYDSEDDMITGTSWVILQREDQNITYYVRIEDFGNSVF